MKAPCLAPAYATLFPAMAELAQENGYALAIHGSMTSDMDLVAVPWTNLAAEPSQLVTVLCNYLNVIRGEQRSGDGSLVHVPEQKPFGRLAYVLPIGHGAAIDLSVMPKTPPASERVIYSIVNSMIDTESYLEQRYREEKNFAAHHAACYKNSALLSVRDAIRRVFNIED